MFSSFFKVHPRKTVLVKNLTRQLIINSEGLWNSIGLKIVNYKSLLKAKSQTLFVIGFKGDVMATASEGMAECISTILVAGDPKRDKVLLKIDSGGGAAHAYGYASSQIERLRDAGFNVVASVDKIAASGGYMMAATASSIISAPYAIIGSIGVVAEFPNFYNLLKSLGVDYKQYTAGKFKRTVSTFAEITEEGEREFENSLKDVYKMFSDHVLENRNVDINKVATGKHWSAVKAKDLGLVDEIMTSQEYIYKHIYSHNVLKLIYVGDNKGFLDKISNNLVKAIFENVVKFFMKSKIEML